MQVRKYRKESKALLKKLNKMMSKNKKLSKISKRNKSDSKEIRKLKRKIAEYNSKTSRLAWNLDSTSEREIVRDTE